MAQLVEMHEKYDSMQSLYGEATLNSIYGAGQIHNPKYFFVFMNPTGRNITALPNWRGLRAPWIGTKQVWKLFFELGVLSAKYFEEIRRIRPMDWTEVFAEEVYANLESNSVFVTNLAKCTQLDARPLKNSIFREYRDLLLEEVKSINPTSVITFGNQVSSIILQKPIKVSTYKLSENEILNCASGNPIYVYPTFYPVGQGTRNLPLAIERIKSI